ncbi:MAG: S8 family serine peptidase, partial [Candidatus Puniceispirillales bacterium]
SGLPYHFPELKPNWLTVVATDIHGREPRYTNQCGVAAAWCVTAPGGGDDQDREGLIGAALDGDYTRKSGTSMAAPIVSGALAVLMDRFPGLTPRQARDRLIATASLDGLTTATGCTLEGCGEAALRQVFGHGMINLGAALQPITPAALIASSGESNPGKTLMLAPSLTGPALTDSLSGAIAVIRDDFDGRHFSLPLPAFVAAAPAASAEGRFRYSRLFDGRFGRGPGQGGTVALFGLGGAIPAERNLPARLIDIPGPASEAWVGYGLDLGEDEHGPWLRVGFGSGAARQSLHLMLADRATMTRWAGIGGDLSSSWLDGDGRGGLGVGESQSVWLFGGVQKDLGLLHLTVEGLTGQTRMAGAETSLIRAAAIDFDAAAVRLSSQASTDEGWSLSLDLPPALREGWIDLDHPTAVSADGISFARRRHDLDLKTREWRSTVQWARQTEAGLNYRLRLSHARNRGHHDGVEETSASVSLVLPF